MMVSHHLSESKGIGEANSTYTKTVKVQQAVVNLMVAMLSPAPSIIPPPL